MPKTIKIRCNGPQKHVNEVDLEKALTQQPVYRGARAAAPEIPERVVLPCLSCTDGKVIVLRAVFEENLK
jgi:hypothetical protein